MGKQLYLDKGVLEVAILIFIAACASVPVLVAKPDPASFLSLDCGGVQTNYNDSRGLQWVSDDSYITTGNSSQLQQYSGDVPALKSFRYFAGDQNKNCYNLPTPSWTYLVRASFYMDWSELATRSSFEFVFSIDATDWFTVTSLDVASQSSLLVVQEAIFYPPYDSASFCVRAVSGTPFISALELRPLDDNVDSETDMYVYPAHLSQFLALGVRYNAGAHNIPDVRYPDDPYDRIWTTPNASVAENLSSISSPQPLSNNSIDGLYKEPLKVMEDAWVSENSSDFKIGFEVFADGPQVYSNPSEYAFVVVYSEILNTSDPGSYDLYIDIGDDGYNDDDYGSYKLHSPFAVAAPYVTLYQNFVSIWLNSTAPSGAFVNALEIYSQLSYNASITSTSDVAVIEALKAIFALTDWQGDPCVPVPYNWLSCDADPTSAFREGQACPDNNCSSTATARSIFAAVYDVTSLTLSNIRNTNFSGINGNSLPNSRLQGLNSMSITSSGVDYQTFLFLVNYTSPGLITLNLSHNAIEELPGAIDWVGADNATFGNLANLDLSHNNLNGQLSTFEDVSFSTALQNLNLSYNNLTSFPEMWSNTTIRSLVNLNLAHNQFVGDLSSLDGWVQINSESLQEFDISYNKLDGTFSSDLYFSLPNLTFANFDNNSIQGILNLTKWHASLQEAARPTSPILSMPTATLQLFSFMNNNIVDIVPSASGFDSTIQSLFRKHQDFGVMLNGNPYCRDIKSSVQHYFCRSSLQVPFKEYSKSKRTEIILVGVLGGLFALLLFSISSVTFWKLRKQVYILRGIQQALADQKVKPPFYHYNDLKIASKDFHKINKLGHGGFGVVYKAVFPDETLAVKKLFNSKKVQVIDEFLNEVVLITGIKHRNLVQLKGCCIKDKQRILVYEYAERGNLADSLWGSQAHGELNWKQRLNICVGVARGLSYLHEELQPSIIHRDIKPENILLDNNFSPKIADFGLARHVSDETNQAHYTQIAGTLGYFAPEYAMQGQVSDKTDVYSYGILILEIISGRKCIDPTVPNEEKFLKDWVFLMRRKLLLFDILEPKLRQDCDPAEVTRAISIALLCVHHHRERRPTMSQVVTMFLGNMDIDVSFDELDNTHYKFKDLKATTANDIEYPSLHAINEESPIFPLLPELGSQSAFAISSSSSSSSRSDVELSIVYGR